MPVLDLSKIPAASPPPGVVPNFVDPPSQAHIPRIFTYVTLPPMLLFIALRIYARIVITHKFGLDDCELFENFLVNDISLHSARPLSARFS